MTREEGEWVLRHMHHVVPLLNLPMTASSRLPDINVLVDLLGTLCWRLLCFSTSNWVSLEFLN